MEEEICNDCGSELAYGEQYVTFDDESRGEIFDVTLGAYWCPCCRYNRVIRA